MKKYTGLMIVGTLISYLLSQVVPAVIFVTTLLAWMIPVLMWRNLDKSALQQASILLGVGFAAVGYASLQGVFLGMQQLLAVNLPLLAMFVAVAFLALTNPAHEDPKLPVGNMAALMTALGTHLLGAVINLSILLVFGDRLEKNGRLTEKQMLLLARSFCAAAWWSPFFIATGVALTYAPQMLLKETLLPGLLMAGIAIGYSLVEVCYLKRGEFSGYPIRLESLLVPVFLAAAVATAHHFFPDAHILLIICIVAPIGSFCFMKQRPRKEVLLDFIGKGILSVNSQFVLFLAAGVFSTGLKSITLVYPAVFNLEGMQFTPFLFAVILGIMIVVGIMGVHPLVSVSIVSPLLLPLEPNHSQLGFLFLSSWAVSTGTSPLSGVGLALVSRYHASPRTIIRINYRYAIAMWLIASLVHGLFWGGHG